MISLSHYSARRSNLDVANNRPNNYVQKRRDTRRNNNFSTAERESQGNNQTRHPRANTSRQPTNRRSQDTSNIKARPSPINARSNREAIPPPEKNVVRIIPIGGVEEIGRNMCIVEVGEDIIVIDAGVQFKEEDTPGIDYILPNTRYLEERKHKIKAIIITHGHLDHIGGIPYIISALGNPPIYTRLLTTAIIKKRQEEFPHLPPLNLHTVEKSERIALGGLFARFFAVTHTIPDSMGIIIETPHGAVVHTGDIKLEHVDGIPIESEAKEFEIFKNINALVLLADSTNVERPGFSIPEPVVQQNIENIIKNTTNRLIIGTFASQLERITRIIEVAEKYNKKVVIEGRSMKNNIMIISELGLLKVRPGTLISAQEMADYPPDRIVALATGAQGDEFAALMRMANKSHKFFKINKKDTVLLSSSIIPGNERAVQKLKDNLSRQGAKIIHYQVVDVHASGHAYRDEMLWIHTTVNPKFFIPIHGYHYMLRVHAELAHSRGIPMENITVPDNGMIIEIDNGEKMHTRRERAPSNVVLVDGFSMGEVQEVVLRDRQMLAQDGMFVIIASINPRNGKLRKSPDIISRGFVYLRESQELLQHTRLIIKKTIENSASGMRPINFDYIKNAVTDDVGRFLFQKTNKRPIVIPVLIGV